MQKMRCLAFSVLSIAMATRASGLREAGPRSCSERVALVLDGVYGRYFAQKIGQLLLDDPFATSQDTKEDLMKRLRKSMLFHCEWLDTATSLLKVVFVFFWVGICCIWRLGYPRIP